MRLRAIRGRWRPCSGIVFVCVFMATVVFIAFEVLDLDGSNLQGRSAGVAIAAEAAPTDVEELLSSSHAVPMSQSRVPAFLDHCCPPEAVKHLYPLDKNTLIARLDQARPRSFLGRKTPPPIPLSDDPA
jgi:hypothetical protein